MYNRKGVPHVGDHSVELGSGILDFLIAEDTSEMPDCPYFFASAVHALQRTPEAVEWNSSEGAFLLSSTLHRAEWCGLAPSLVFQNPISPVLPAGAENWLPTTITLVPGVLAGKLPPTIYEPYLIGKTVDTYAIEDVLASKLMYYAPGISQILSSVFLQQPLYWDNHAWYAKLWTYSLGMAQIGLSGVKLTAPPAWTNPPTFIILRGANAILHAQILANAVRSGNLILLENVHFTLADLPIIYLLAAGGVRYGVAVNAPHHPWQTLEWPAFPITLVVTSQDAAPPAPAPVHPYSETICRFCIRLADSRSERVDCVNGLYSATDFIGSNWAMYLSIAAVPNLEAPYKDLPVPNVHVLCTPWHESSGRITLPRPHDSNFLVCILSRIPREISGNIALDWKMIFQCAIVDLHRTSLLVASLTSISVTTFAYSLQLSGAVLQRYMWPTQNPPHVNLLLDMGICKVGASGEIPLLIEGAVRLLSHGTGMMRPLEQLTGHTWNAQPVNLPGMHQPWNFGIAWLHNTIPYTRGNPLAGAQFFTKRPLEWGICNLRPKCNFAEDVNIYGPDSSRGWCALRGSTDYAARAKSGSPYILVPYGAFAVNVLTQYSNLILPPVLMVQTCNAIPDSLSCFGAPEPLAVQPIWHEASKTFQPCTIMTYDLLANEVQALFWNVKAIPGGDGVLQQWIHIQNENVQNAGLSGPIQPATAYPVTFQPPGLLRRRIAGATPVLQPAPVKPTNDQQT